MKVFVGMEETPFFSLSPAGTIYNYKVWTVSVEVGYCRNHSDGFKFVTETSRDGAIYEHIAFRAYATWKEYSELNRPLFVRVGSRERPPV